MNSVKRFRIAAAAIALAVIPALSQAQQMRRVTGIVTVQGSTEPVPSASIQVVGTTFGTTADETGHFSLSVPNGDQQLRVRRLGYTAKVIPVAANDNTVSVALARDVLQLEAQVITGQATTVSSVNAANAVTVVSSEKLNKVPAQTIDNALQGKVPGAVISSNSGAPGGGVQVQLRGVSTINAGFQPLYVIDGVIANNAAISNGLNVISQAARGDYSSSQDQQVNRIADLNPNDIESIQVLKGPSAASIYGSKGTNGVIVITTKQGRAGKTAIDVTQRFGKSYLSNKLDIRCFGSAQEYATWALAQGYVDSASTAVRDYNASPTKCNDYQDQFYGRSPLSYQTIASVRGGTEHGTTYYGSGLVQHDGGLAPNDQYSKQSLRLNLGQQLGSRLNVKANSEIIHTLTQRGISGNDNANISPYNVFSVTPSFFDMQRRPDGTFPRNPFITAGSNVFQDAEYVKTPENVIRMIGSATGTLNLINQEHQTLDATLTGAADAYNDHARILSPSFLYFEQANPNPGTLFSSNGNFVNANLNLSLAHRLITGIGTAATSAGLRQERREYDVVQLTGRGVVFSNVTSIDQAVNTYPSEGQGLDKDFSYFGQEEFTTWGDKLLLTAGINAERSSNNGDQHKFYAYPKFSASLNVPWLPPATNRLKLRVAYGRAGNQPTAGRYTYLTTLLQEGVTGARASTTKGAKGIKPEQASELEGGFDLTMFGGRMNFSATQYRKQIDNLLLQASTAPSTGFSSQWINGGQIVSHGTELELDATPIQTGKVTWLSTTTYASNFGRVTRLPVPAFRPGVGSFGPNFGNAWIQEGMSTSIIQAYVGCSKLNSAGRCPTANKIIGYPGDANPDFIMGFNNTLNVGPFQVSTLFDWRKGGDVINLTNNYYDGANTFADTAMSQARLAGYRRGEAVYVEKATFLKWRELSLSYTLPSAMASRMFMGRAESVRLELSGRNLKTWTPYTGLDPEVSNFSDQALGRMQDVTPYPPSRSFFFTIATTF